MKTNNKIFFAAGLFFFLIVLSFNITAQVPRTISYQGVLTDQSGNTKPDGDYSITFSFYENETGLDPIWTESKTLSVKKGLFSTALGGQTSFNAEVKFDKQYWLGIKVGDEPELSPRIALTSAAYSLSADNVSDGKVVKSLNGLKDDITLEGGGGTTITAAENKITISSSTGGGTGILGVQNTNNTLDISEPNGPTATVNLKVPLTLNGSTTDYVLTAVNAGEGHGIKGQSTGTGVYGESDDWYGVYGFSPAGTGTGGKSNTGTGVSAESGTGYGLYAFSEFGHGIHGGSVNDYGIVGVTTNGWGGVYGETTGKAYGILGYHNSGDQLWAGVYGYGGSENYAGRFDGTVLNYGSVYMYNDLYVFGDEHFGTDHPLDPANKYLLHSDVLSPERMNIYNGNVVTDASGEAVVKLPDYFQSFNTDFRYQLTVIGKPAQVWIEKEINNNQMTIKSDKGNIKVSWQVTGVRNDRYSKEHPFVPEVEKTGNEKGKYLRPELFGQTEEKGIYHVKAENRK